MLLKHVCVPAPLVVLCALVAAALPCGAFALQPAAEAPVEPAVGLVVPALPEGTPAELIAFVEGLLPPKQQPRGEINSLCLQAQESVATTTQPLNPMLHNGQ